MTISHVLIFKMDVPPFISLDPLKVLSVNPFLAVTVSHLGWGLRCCHSNKPTHPNARAPRPSHNNNEGEHNHSNTSASTKLLLTHPERSPSLRATISPPISDRLAQPTPECCSAAGWAQLEQHRGTSQPRMWQLWGRRQELAQPLHIQQLPWHSKQNYGL